MITRMTPWSIAARVDGESITLLGEMYPSPRFGQDDFFGLGWAMVSNDEGVPLSIDRRMQLLRLLQDEAGAEGITVRLDLTGIEYMVYSGVPQEKLRYVGKIKDVVSPEIWEKLRPMVENGDPGNESR